MFWFKNLTEIVSGYYLGLNCSTGFIAYKYWCKSENLKCEGISVRHSGICSSHELWNGRVCDKMNPDEKCEGYLGSDGVFSATCGSYGGYEGDRHERLCKKFPGRCLVSHNEYDIVGRCNGHVGYTGGVYRFKQIQDIQTLGCGVDGCNENRFDAECGNFDFSDENCYKNDSMYDVLSKYFVCQNKEQKIHPTSVCNGYLDCQDESDERDDLCNRCPLPDTFLDSQDINITTSWRYTFPHLKPSASYRCKHRETGLDVCSTPGDGVHECSGYFTHSGIWLSKDEENIAELWNYIFLG